MAEPASQIRPAQDRDAMTTNATGGASHPITQLAGACRNNAAPLPAATRVDDTRSGVYYPTNRAEWLDSTYVYAENPGRLTVKDLSKIKAANHDEDSYWQDTHIKWALELIRRRHGGLNDVTIVSSNICSMLYQAGVNPDSVPDTHSLEDIERRNYEDTYAPIVKELSEYSFVILPVNNGYRNYGQAISAPTEGLPEKDKPQNQKRYKESQGQGSHWSFIVVDRHDAENPAAFYLDGMVKAGKRNNRWEIRGINLNGKVAGVVLRGFDTLLELEKAKFNARTLKFVPHMADANASHGFDKGACGPYLYAFMDHILTRKTTMVDSDLQSTYNDEDSRDARRAELAFDSVATRARFAEELLQERRQQEALQPQNFLDNLTPHVLQSLMTVDGLIGLARATDFLSAGRRGRRPARKDRTFSKDDDDVYGDPPLPKSFLREEVKKHLSTYEDIVDLEDCYPIAYGSLIAQQEKQDAEKSNQPKNSTETPNTKNFYLGKNLYRNVPLDDKFVWPEWETDTIDFPGQNKRVPDFANISPSPGLPAWLNKSVLLNKKINREKKGWRFTARAVLHYKFKKSFLGEPDAHFERVWSHDATVFDPNDQEVIDMKGQKDANIRFGLMRLKMMRYYQGDEEVGALLKHLRMYKSSPKAPTSKNNRKDDDGDDDHPYSGDSTRRYHDQPELNNSGNPSNSSGHNNKVMAQSGAPHDPIASTSTAGSKRKCTSDPSTCAKKLKLSSTDFLKMGKKSLTLWIEEMPLTFRSQFPTVLESEDICRARIWLERMFGEGFEHLGHEQSLTEASMSKLRQWRFKLEAMNEPTQAGFKKFLLEILLADPKIDGRVVPVPDLRSKLKKIRAEEDEASTGAIPTTQTPTAQPTTGNNQANASFGSEKTVENPTVTIQIGRDAYILNSDDASAFLPWDTTRTAWPSNTTSLPDFTTIPASELDTWSTASPEVQSSFNTHDGPATLETLRAALHMKFKRTFLHEPDAAFSTTWIKDGSVFDAASAQTLLALPTPESRNGEIRRRIMLAYEPAMLDRIEARPRPRLANPKSMIQGGSLEEPQSFDSQVHGTGRPVAMGRASVDPGRLAPRAMRESEPRRGREGLRSRPRPIEKRREG